MATDVRVQYTKMIIRKSFIALLKSKPLSKITVKEICDSAQINRSTFYKHYMDVFDLFESIEAEMLEEYHELIYDLKKVGINKTLIRILEGFKRNIEAYETLFGLNDDNTFNTKLAMDFFSELTTTVYYDDLKISPEKQSWLFHFCVCGTGGILHTWLKGGMKETPEQVADFIEKLLNNIIETAKKQ